MVQIPMALVQFDALPEASTHNLACMERLATQAAQAGARWVMFHEGTLCDYTPRVAELAERVPEGPATQRMTALAQRLGGYISFGLSEKCQGRYYQDFRLNWAQGVICGHDYQIPIRPVFDQHHHELYGHKLG